MKDSISSGKWLVEIEVLEVLTTYFLQVIVLRQGSTAAMLWCRQVHVANKEHEGNIENDGRR